MTYIIYIYVRGPKQIKIKKYLLIIKLYPDKILSKLYILQSFSFYVNNILLNKPIINN